MKRIHTSSTVGTTVAVSASALGCPVIVDCAAAVVVACNTVASRRRYRGVRWIQESSSARPIVGFQVCKHGGRWCVCENVCAGAKHAMWQLDAHVSGFVCLGAKQGSFGHKATYPAHTRTRDALTQTLSQLFEPVAARNTNINHYPLKRSIHCGRQRQPSTHLSKSRLTR